MDYTLQEQFIGQQEHKELKSKTVAIVGLGGMGSTAAQILARNGVNLRIVDKDRVLEVDIARLTLYTSEDINKFKAKQAKKRLEDINENIKIKSFHEELSKDNLFLIDADLIIDASNHMETTLMINKYAMDKNIPLIIANYAGSKGHVFIVDKNQFKKKGACANCIKDKLEMAPITQEGVFSPITTLIAALIANAAMKNLLHIPNIDSLICIDLMKTEIRRTHVEKKRGCAHGK